MQLMSAIFRAYNDWFAKFRRLDPSPSGASMINHLDDGEARDRFKDGMRPGDFFTATSR